VFSGWNRLFVDRKYCKALGIVYKRVRKMNIVFISPIWTDELGVFSSIARRRKSQPPLGILYLSSVARRRNHRVRIIDAEVEKYTMFSLVEEIINGDVDLVGITAPSMIFHKAISFAKALKASGFKKPIMVGGAHANIFRKDAFLDCFDFLFFGESDSSLESFLSVLEHEGSDFSGINGLIYRDGENIIENEPVRPIEDLDAIDFPALDLVRKEKYVMTFAMFKRRSFLPIMASRGCPFKCVFCSEPQTNPTVRFRSAKNVVDEIEKWNKDLEISHYYFLDSNLTLKRGLVEGICNEIKRRKLNITFEGMTRANLIDKEILVLLKSAGLIRLSVGLESADPEILRIIKKEVSPEEMVEAFRLSDKLGIELACTVMLGLPGETRKSVERTIAFVRNTPHIRYANFSIANPHLGTEMYEWALTGKHGIRLLEENMASYRRYGYSPVSVNDLSQKDLVYLQKVGLLKIHCTFRRIVGMVRLIGFFYIVPVIFAVIKEYMSNQKGKNLFHKKL